MMDQPFDIQIHRNSEPPQTCRIRCRDLLRELPGRRLVYEGQWDNRDVIVKIFTSRWRSKFHIQREFRGFENLTKRRIQTPEVLFTGIDDKNRSVLVMQKIPHSQDLLSALEAFSDTADREEMIHNLVRFLARMNEKGIVQRDLHAGKTFCLEKMVYTRWILHKCSLKDRPLDKKASLNQLAMLMSSIPRTYHPDAG